MPSLHPFRKHWRVHYRVMGAQVAETYPTKAEAQKRLAEVKYQLSRGLDPRTGRLLSKGRGITFVEALSQFGEWSAKRQRAKKTLARDMDTLLKLAADAPEFLSDLRAQHLKAFLDTRATECASTYNKAVFAIRAFCRAMLELEHLTEDLCREVKARRIPRKVPDVLTVEEVRELLSAFFEFDRPFAMFVATTGCRRGEACQLKWSDVDLPRVVIRSPKEKHDKVIILPEGLCEEIRNLPRTSPLVFPNRKGAMRQHSLHHLIKTAAKEVLRKRILAGSGRKMLVEDDHKKKFEALLNSDEGRAWLKKCHWHAFRHTVATYLITQEPPAVVQQLLGHQQLSTTMIYVQLSGEHLKKAAEGSLSRLFEQVKPEECVTEVCNNDLSERSGNRNIPSSRSRRSTGL